MTTGKFATPMRERLESIDVIRGIGILWIVLVHVTERLIPYGSYFANPATGWPPFAERVVQMRPLPIGGIDGVLVNALRYVGWLGDQGVQILLVVSGFVLTVSVMGSADAASRGSFLRRRIGRILPQWVVVHVAAMLLALFTSTGMSPFDWRTWASLFGLRFIPAVMYDFSPAWWYFGLLIQLYLIFPYLGRLLRKVRPVVFAGAIIGGSVIVRLVGLYTFDGLLDWWSRGAVFVTRLPEFAFGMLLAYWYTRDRQGFLRTIRRPVVVVGAVVAYLAGVAASFTLAGMSVAFLLTGGGFVVVALAVTPSSFQRRFGPLRWAGEHAYPIYLVHHPIIIVAVGATAVTIGAAASYAITAGLFVATIVAAIALEKGTVWIVGVLRRWQSDHGPIGVVARFVAIIATVAVIGYGTELVVRAFAPQEVYGWGERPSLQSDETFGVKLIPNQSTRLRWSGYDYTLDANDLGFSGPLYPEARRPESLRVMVTGDAFSSAEGVDTYEAWPRLMETLLGESTGHECEVLNFSISGFSPNQFAAVVEEFAPTYNPDVVVVEFFVNEFQEVRDSNADFANRVGFGTPPPFGLRSFLTMAHFQMVARELMLSRVWELLRGTMHWRGHGLGNYFSIARENESFMRDSVPLIRDRMESISEVCRRTASELVVVLVPASVQVAHHEDLRYLPRTIDLSDESKWDLDQPQRMTIEILDDLGIDYIDLREPLRAAADGRPYHPTNMHWTEFGHEVVAEHVAAEIQKRYLTRE